jgi:acyl-CoA synthetase (AMP-forming)/AMP-acid ligase II
MYQRNSVYAVETLVSASRAGADALLLNTFLSPTQVTEVLHRERPAVLVVDAELRPNVVDVPDGTTVVIGAPEDGAGTGEQTLGRPRREHRAGPAGPQRKGPADRPDRRARPGAPKGAKRGAPKGLGPAASILSRIRFKAPETDGRSRRRCSTPGASRCSSSRPRSTARSCCAAARTRRRSSPPSPSTARRA